MLAPRDPSPPSSEVVRRLSAKHAEFLSFLASRLRSRAVAEEILQVAFVRMLERGGSIAHDESAVAWFYRVLRNALADYYRNTASETRALEGFSLEPGADPETHNAVCACLRGVVPTLKAEYADLIARVDLDDQPIVEVAKRSRYRRTTRPSDCVEHGKHSRFSFSERVARAQSTAASTARVPA